MMNISLDKSQIKTLRASNVDLTSLPKFGENPDDDVTEFLTKLELMLSFYELDDNLKAKVIPLILTKRAYTFYLGLPKITKNSYYLLTESLREEFDSPQLKYRKRQELHNIRQNGETISNYLTRLEKLSQNLNIVDQTKMDIAISGLDESYRQFIQMEQPKTYTDCTHLLLLKESVDPPKDNTAVLNNILAVLDQTSVENYQLNSNEDISNE